LALGWPSVEWGLANVTCREIAEWREFYAIEPFGYVRGDLQAGVIASTVINYSGKTLKDDAPMAKPSDFVMFSERAESTNKPILEDDPEAQSALMLAALFGVAPGE
jgi:hypothetical protein